MNIVIRIEKILSKHRKFSLCNKKYNKIVLEERLISLQNYTAIDIARSLSAKESLILSLEMSLLKLKMILKEMFTKQEL